MLLFTHELQRRLTQAGSRLPAHAVHPGYAATSLRGPTLPPPRPLDKNDWEPVTGTPLMRGGSVGRSVVPTSGLVMLPPWVWISCCSWRTGSV